MANFLHHCGHPFVTHWKILWRRFWSGPNIPRSMEVACRSVTLHQWTKYLLWVCKMVRYRPFPPSVSKTMHYILYRFIIMWTTTCPVFPSDAWHKRTAYNVTITLLYDTRAYIRSFTFLFLYQPLLPIKGEQPPMFSQYIVKDLYIQWHNISVLPYWSGRYISK